MKLNCRSVRAALSEWSVTPRWRGICVESLAYLRDRPPPASPDDLRAHRCVGYRLSGSGALLRWEFERHGQAMTLNPDGAMVVNDHDMLVAAALDGAGVACVTERSVSRHLEAGRLMLLLDAWSQPFDGFDLYYPDNRVAVPALGALTDAIRWKG